VVDRAGRPDGSRRRRGRRRRRHRAGARDPVADLRRTANRATVLAVMVRKETIRKMVGMHAPASRNSHDRDRAVDRIRRLTVGTTVAGIVGIGAFGGLAATTWRGTDTTVTTAAVITTTGDDAGSGAD